MFTKKNLFFALFIIVFIACCLFSNKVFADEGVEWSLVEDVYAPGSATTITSGSGIIEYFHTYDNYIYTITNNHNLSTYSIRISTSAPAVGVSYSNLIDLGPGQSYTFIGNSDYYFHYGNSSTTMGQMTVTRSLVNGYDNTIDNLTQAISLDNLWSQFGVGLIALAVLFAIGFFVVRKVLRKDSQYKG